MKRLLILFLIIPFLSYSKNFNNDSINLESYKNIIGLEIIGTKTVSGTVVYQKSSSWGNMHEESFQYNYVPLGLYYERKYSNLNLATNFTANVPLVDITPRANPVFGALDFIVSRNILDNAPNFKNSNYFAGALIGLSSPVIDRFENIKISIGLMIGTRKLSLKNPRYGFDLKFLIKGSFGKHKTGYDPGFDEEAERNISFSIQFSPFYRF